MMKFEKYLGNFDDLKHKKLGCVLTELLMLKKLYNSAANKYI